MLRRTLLWASRSPSLAERLPRYAFVRRAVRRFMPGEEPADALDEAGRLQEGGAATIVSLLGENVDSSQGASDVAEHYQGVLLAVTDRALDAEVSVKLTHLGLDLSPDLALEHVRTLAAASASADQDRPRTLWLDMESSAYVDRTLDLYRTLRREHENVGVCLQAYLRRTEADLEALLPLRPTIRLVKGAYLEPADVAHPKKRTVDAQYRRLAERLLRERKLDRVGRPAIATHDSRIVAEVARMADELELPTERYEFEMLYGIALGQQRTLLERGYALRVLISYGAAWFPWYMRRLAERPANLAFVIKQMMTR